MESVNLSSLHKVQLTNEDYNFNGFVKTLFEKGQFAAGPQALRCKKSQTRATLGSTFKAVELEFFPHEGLYTTKWNDNVFYLEVKRGTHVLTTECRQIDYLKYLTVYGEDLSQIQAYLQ